MILTKKFSEGEESLKSNEKTTFLYWIHAIAPFFSPGRSQQSARGHAGGGTRLQLGETKQPPISMVEIPADLSPPACYILP